MAIELVLEEEQETFAWTQMRRAASGALGNQGEGGGGRGGSREGGGEAPGDNAKGNYGLPKGSQCRVVGNPRVLATWLTRTFFFMIRTPFSLVSHSCLDRTVSSVGGVDLR